MDFRVSLEGFQVRRLTSVAGIEVVKLQSTPRSGVEVQEFMVQVKKQRAEWLRDAGGGESALRGSSDGPGDGGVGAWRGSLRVPDARRLSAEQ